MKRLLAYLIVVISLGLVFSKNIYSAEKLFFCQSKSDLDQLFLSKQDCSSDLLGILNYHSISKKKFIFNFLNRYNSVKSKKITLINNLTTLYSQFDLYKEYSSNYLTTN